jgi:DNA invertase Pin-like site-specific DNA recombinase
MLTKYAKEHGLKVISEYVDDGYSGITFERPGFQRMIADIEAEKINVVLVKDMSRFGRNHVWVDYYREIVFPEKEVRMIAINDDYDSALGDNEMMPFKSLMNEWYCRDISKKLRTAHRIHAQAGRYTGEIAPYGYLKDPTDKHHLIVDNEKAPLIRDIFAMAEEGHSCKYIAKAINQRGIPSARNSEYGWTSATVLNILKNETYLGHVVRLKTTTPSFKIKHSYLKPKDEWVKVANMHEPIIQQETYDTVQRYISLHKRPPSTGFNNIFRGMVHCADCGRWMGFHANCVKGGAFICGSYSRGTQKCSPHHTPYDALHSYVLEEINKLISAKSEPALFNNLLENSIPDETNSKKKSLDKLIKRDTEIKELIRRVFEQNTLGMMDDDVFHDLYNGYCDEKKRNAEAISKLQDELKKNNSRQIEQMRLKGIIESFHDKITELDRPIITSLIEYIEVFEPTGKKYAKNRKLNIKIKWLFGNENTQA